jgi:phosphoadenosine phosphosulfate reductase
MPAFAGMTTRVVERMPLWKSGAFVDDPWQIVPDDQPVPADVPAILTLKRWRENRETLAMRNAPLGLQIDPGLDWSDVVADLPRFPVVVVTIPKYADGRAFSIARLLRERDGYKGEIRAVGNYIIDQVPYMARVGIDAYLTADPHVIKAFDEGVWPEVPHYLQPAFDHGTEIPAGTRPWIRKRT